MLLSLFVASLSGQYCAAPVAAPAYGYTYQNQYQYAYQAPAFVDKVFFVAVEPAPAYYGGLVAQSIRNADAAKEQAERDRKIDAILGAVQQAAPAPTTQGPPSGAVGAETGGFAPTQGLRRAYSVPNPLPPYEDSAWATPAPAPAATPTPETDVKPDVKPGPPAASLMSRRVAPKGEHAGVALARSKCASCHSGSKSRGGYSLFDDKGAFTADVESLAKANSAVAEGRMPPKERLAETDVVAIKSLLADIVTASVLGGR